MISKEELDTFEPVLRFRINDKCVSESYVSPIVAIYIYSTFDQFTQVLHLMCEPLLMPFIAILRVLSGIALSDKVIESLLFWWE